jgi:hypothetical protein
MFGWHNVDAAATSLPYRADWPLESSIAVWYPPVTPRQGQGGGSSNLNTPRLSKDAPTTPSSSSLSSLISPRGSSSNITVSSSSPSIDEEVWQHTRTLDLEVGTKKGVRDRFEWLNAFRSLINHTRVELKREQKEREALESSSSSGHRRKKTDQKFDSATPTNGSMNMSDEQKLMAELAERTTLRRTGHGHVTARSMGVTLLPPPQQGNKRHGRQISADLRGGDRREEWEPLHQLYAAGYPLDILTSVDVALVTRMEWTCTSCGHLPRNPYELSCGHLICRSCAYPSSVNGAASSSIMACSIDHTAIASGDALPSLAIQRSLNRLNVRCPSHWHESAIYSPTSPCEWHGYISAMLNHISVCPSETQRRATQETAVTSPAMTPSSIIEEKTIDKSSPAVVPVNAGTVSAPLVFTFTPPPPDSTPPSSVITTDINSPSGTVEREREISEMLARIASDERASSPSSNGSGPNSRRQSVGTPLVPGLEPHRDVEQRTRSPSNLVRQGSAPSIITRPRGASAGGNHNSERKRAVSSGDSAHMPSSSSASTSTYTPLVVINDDRLAIPPSDRVASNSVGNSGNGEHKSSIRSGGNNRHVVFVDADPEERAEHERLHKDSVSSSDANGGEGNNDDPVSKADKRLAVAAAAALRELPDAPPSQVAQSPSVSVVPVGEGGIMGEPDGGEDDAPGAGPPRPRGVSGIVGEIEGAGGVGEGQENKNYVPQPVIAASAGADAGETEKTRVPNGSFDPSEGVQPRGRASAIYLPSSPKLESKRNGGMIEHQGTTPLLGASTAPVSASGEPLVFTPLHEGAGEGEGGVIIEGQSGEVVTGGQPTIALPPVTLPIVFTPFAGSVTVAPSPVDSKLSGAGARPSSSIDRARNDEKESKRILKDDSDVRPSPATTAARAMADEQAAKANHRGVKNAEKDEAKRAAELTMYNTALLRRGGEFLKHGRQGKPHLCQVKCSHDLSKVQWGDKSAPSSKIIDVILGRSTRVCRWSHFRFLFFVLFPL